MAVVRITFPDRRAVESFAAALATQPGMERGVREVLRTLERHGWSAELTEPEVHAAWEAREHMTLGVQLLARKAEDRAVFMAEYDRERRVAALARGEASRARFAELSHE